MSSFGGRVRRYALLLPIACGDECYSKTSSVKFNKPLYVTVVVVYMKRIVQFLFGTYKNHPNYAPSIRERERIRSKVFFQSNIKRISILSFYSIMS